MDIQPLLIFQTRGTLDFTIYSLSTLKDVKKKLDAQMKLIGLCQNKNAIPQSNAMKSLLKKIQTELNRRSNEANV